VSTAALVPTDLYPFEGKRFDVGNGIQMHYLDEGQGDPVVMVHGNPSWSFYYRDLVLRLRGRYRCIVPDHIGCGLSDKPGDDRYTYTFTQRVDDLAKLLDHLGVGSNVTLVVHDWGGMIGMTWAARYPDRVRRLVILNTAAFHLPATKPFPWQLWLARDTAFGGFLVTRFNAFSGAAAWVGCTRKRMSPRLREAYTAPYNTPANRIATLRFVQDIPLRAGDRGYDVISEVESLLPRFRGLPIFIGWGLRDFVFDKHFLARWLEFFPEAEVLRVEDGGHYILEDAADLMLPAIDQFLTAHPLTASAPAAAP
jgi:pimeloyl-ACP methyl ester carboxylesterase